MLLRLPRAIRALPCMPVVILVPPPILRHLFLYDQTITISDSCLTHIGLMGEYDWLLLLGFKV